MKTVQFFKRIPLWRLLPWVLTSVFLTLLVLTQIGPNYSIPASIRSQPIGAAPLSPRGS